MITGLISCLTYYDGHAGFHPENKFGGEVGVLACGSVPLPINHLDVTK